ncbi:histidine kinase [Wukongibacter baidiensis]|uniref:histidine kinase n=1 Tax=Wukongibacter baidiensis TaxID=1723361 RepID=UPI003D7FD759
MIKDNIQFFDWGQIEWIHEPEKSNFKSVMNIGIVTIFSGKRQNKHIHYGDEQVIYGLSGKGEQIIGNKTSTMEPGSIFHIQAGSTHETINDGEEPLKELLISIPVNHEQEIFLKNRKQKQEHENSKIYPVDIKLNQEVKYIFDKIIEPLKIPMAIFDDKGHIVLKTSYYPEFCRAICNIDEKLCNCSLYNIKGEYAAPQYTDPSAFVCPYGLTVFIQPIIYNNKVVGVIKGGHIREAKSNIKIKTKEDKEIISLPYDTPKSTVNAILQLMKRLCKNIINYYIFKNSEIELNKKDEIINDIVQNEIMLEEALKNTEGKVLSIQINNHFLFNTLNAIASLAIRENSLNTYDAIINLSKMFRYSLKKSSYFVELREEIEYLKNYINLQKIRYGSKVAADFNISLEVENINVPFNFLQPIIENSFNHGFKDVKDNMKIIVTARQVEDRTIIEINDNGIGMKQDELTELKLKITNEDEYELNGLKMIFLKLGRFYGNNFSFDINSQYKRGTTVKISLPDKII